VSFWAAIGRAAKAAIEAYAATKGAPASVLPAPGEVVGAIAGSKITFGQLVTSAKTLEGSSIGAKLRELVTNIGNVDNDLDVAMEVASVLAPMLPIAGEVDVALYVLKVGYDLAKRLPASTWAAAPRGGPPIAEADWSHGPPAFPLPWEKPLPEPKNPSGAIGGE
jgi:hypothetical protein